MDIEYWRHLDVRVAGAGRWDAVTEDGEIYNPFFRVMSKLVFGYHRTQESYLNALGQKFGEEVTVERLRQRTQKRRLDTTNTTGQYFGRKQA